SVEPDTYSGAVQTGDVFLVASDGLTGMVDDRRIAYLLSLPLEPRKIVDALIKEANARGGLDNITAIVIRIEGVDADNGRAGTHG
ncbi:MAG: Protein serine/threonine phosphatase PrpC, regulation of stationary phase, partial [uncultured Gemmatimonadaceae bacterium]